VISSLPPDSVTADLGRDPSVSQDPQGRAPRRDRRHRLLLGRGTEFRYATNSPALKAFVVCYGPSPNPADMAKISAKGLGVYAENDARIYAGLPGRRGLLCERAGKDYPYTVYPGVGHGFLRLPLRSLK